jgi:hypothetical protein
MRNSNFGNLIKQNLTSTFKTEVYALYCGAEFMWIFGKLAKFKRQLLHSPTPKTLRVGKYRFSSAYFYNGLVVRFGHLGLFKT